MNYNIEISNFEGPLDLLLHLIKKSEMNIEDISIEEITKQYFDYIHMMENLNLNIASEYLVMASELLEIKSQNLLPNNNLNLEEEIEEDLRENLITKLKDYERYKEISKLFKNYEDARSEIYTKNPTLLNCDMDKKNKHEEDFGLNDLIEAFNNMIERKKFYKPLNTKITNKEYSLNERNFEIKNILKDREQIDFVDLFDHFDKDYIVITFLSILTLSKEKEIKILQEGNFKEIVIKRG